jgi:hypothetical protein
MQVLNMKDVAKDIITQAIRKDLLEYMKEHSTGLDFCEWAGRELNSNKKTIAQKFREGFWTTKDFDAIEALTGGENLKKAFQTKSQS